MGRAASGPSARPAGVASWPPGGIEELWSAIGRHVSRSELELAAATVHQLASQPDADDGQDAAFRSELLRRYHSLRRFLPTMLETISFDAAPAGKQVLDALESLWAWKAGPAGSAPARCR